jgi:hypothetical protein
MSPEFRDVRRPELRAAPRARLADLLKRSEASPTGNYVLVGPDPDRASGTRAYIGEADNVGVGGSSHEPVGHREFRRLPTRPASPRPPAFVDILGPVLEGGEVGAEAAGYPVAATSIPNRYDRLGGSLGELGTV